jgi:hypothetical protein
MAAQFAYNPPLDPTLSVEDQQRVLDAYGLEFFDSTFSRRRSGMLEGRTLPAGVRTDKIDLAFARGGALTIDDFEENGPARNAFGGANRWAGVQAQESVFAASVEVAEYPGAAVFQLPESPRNGTSYSFEGRTRGLVLSGAAGTYTFSLGGPKDLRGAEIWIRAAELARNSHLLPQGPQSASPPARFDVGLVSVGPLGRVTAWVGTEQVGGVSAPYRIPGDSRDPLARSVLKTLVFPVGCFSRQAPLLDLSRISEIILRPRTPSVMFAIDDVQIVPSNSP